MPDSSSTTDTATEKKVVRKRTVAPKESASNDLSPELPAAAPKKKATRKPAVPVISPEERHHLISVAAYFIAERSATASCSPHDDWLQAEKEIDAMIAAGKFSA